MTLKKQEIVMIVPTKGPAYMKKVENDSDTLRELVGSWSVQLPKRFMPPSLYDAGIRMFLNEDGLPLGLEYNNNLERIDGPWVGTAVFTGSVVSLDPDYMDTDCSDCEDYYDENGNVSEFYLIEEWTSLNVMQITMIQKYLGIKIARNTPESKA